MPDPPQEIQVEAGPQDGTLLVTWQPVTRPPSSGPVTGYAVYADGKKVTDVDSPTGDHALIDIGKLVGLNPRAVTVRTKSRDSQSADSTPTMIPTGAELMFSVLVPAPKHLTLERQLNKSVLIGWSQPDPPMCNQIESYHVYVDGVLKVTVKATERTRALVEGVDSNRPHRISVRSVTQNRRTSRDAACTMIIGRDTAHLGPSAVRATNITCSSAVISWLPANSNHQHVVCVNNVEVRTRMMNNQVMGGMNNQMQQMNPNQVIDHDENLSDKEIYPGSMHQQERSQRDSNSSSIPAIEITKDAAGDTYVSDDSEYQDGASSGGGSSRRRSGSHGPPQQQQVNMNMKESPN
uniref:Fibronectin type-III domain-containing protein n=1 Tax=Anopheles culicifacies TaxID=139723 RepID=A0A182MW01_9DIPT